MALDHEAVALLQNVWDVWNILWPLRGLVWMAVVRGDEGQVLAIVEEQIESLRDRQETDGLVFLLHLFGVLVSASGDVTRATALLRETMALQWERRSHLIPEHLEAFAWLAVEQGHVVRAAHLLGATDSMLEGKSIYIATRFAHQHLVGKLRAQLGETMFAAAWVEGKAMTLEQAVAYSLSGA
jgi:hypothetical protein